ncbi:MarR family winged helix-turn-helix transcriptional regulator [Streptomyces sp. NRRL S-813]|uniref:MarR family winged helix-turn-helix transcriptional regulator n=1 Tax=Streptomyces sp. NRRL S-813 TaxID=1463919 RepID=UPI00068A937B|nr:MarR family transcriptional regulator [Streptomyces sp. NRRL S-813]
MGDGARRSHQAETKVQEPVWLTDGEREAWHSLATLIIRLPAALDEQLRRDAEVTLFEYRLLSRLSEASDRSLRMSDLADLVHASRSRLSYAVKRLENRGWVRRVPCPEEDGRGTTAVLTEAGWAKTVATAPRHVDAVRDLVIDACDGLELVQLGRITDQILRRIDSGVFRPVVSEPSTT